jgi:hypothetical protein
MGLYTLHDDPSNARLFLKGLRFVALSSGQRSGNFESSFQKECHD